MINKVYNFIFSLLLLVSATKAQTFTFSIVPSNTFACAGVKTSFSATSAAQGISYTWSVSPAKFAVLSAKEGNTTDITFTKDAAFVVTATGTDGTSTATQTFQLSAFKTATAAFNASLDAVGFPAKLHLTNYSGNSSSNVWLFSDLNTPDSTSSTVREYTTSGSYAVTLIALGQKVCHDTSTYRFRISDSSAVTLPNVFSPNRDDINDLYRPITVGISSLSAWVYNRDGILIANWTKVQGSWDGRTSSGEVCAEGVYFVVVEAQGFDGKSYKLKSSITLVR